MPDAAMQIALFNADTDEGTLLVGLTGAQLARFGARPGEAAALEARLDDAGYLAVWQCRRTADRQVELVQPIILQAGAVRAFAPAPSLPMRLVA